MSRVSSYRRKVCQDVIRPSLASARDRASPFCRERPRTMSSTVDNPSRISQDEARLNEHLDRHPGDFASRLVLADLLDERGCAEAARCQRWLGTRRLYPDEGWRWQASLHSRLPDEIVLEQPAARYKTRAEAEAALARALAALDKDP